MIEIDAAVTTRITTDNTLKGYLGATAGDTRLYSWYPVRDIVYTSSTPAAIIYGNNMGGRSHLWSFPDQIPNAIYFFRVLSIGKLKLENISERLIALFDKTSITTTHFSVKWIVIAGCTDGANEGSVTNPIFVKNVSFSFSNVFRRT